MIDLTDLPIDITKHILAFKDFLNSSWPHIDVLMENHDWDEDGSFISDWIQANWEFLMERELLGEDRYLMPLEWNNRITFPDKKAQYKVACELNCELEIKDWISKSSNYHGERLLIFGFRSPTGISYGLYPPFDFVELRTYEKNKTYIVPINQCRFLLKRI